MSADPLDAPAHQLSIVVCTLDMSGLLLQQLEALAAQRTSADFEIIVVDNNSEDDTVARVEDFAESHPDLQMRLVVNPARGLNRSRNVGASHAQFSYVALCDADDLVEPGWVDEMQRNVSPNTYCGGALRRAGPNNMQTRQRWGADPEPVVEAYRHHGVLTPPGCNCAFPHRMWANIGGFDERLRDAGDETEFFRRAFDAGFTYVEAPDAIVSYRLPSSPPEVWRRGTAYGRATERLIDLEGRETRSFIQRRWKYWPRLILTAVPHLAPRRGRYDALHRLAKAWGEITYRNAHRGARNDLTRSA